ncbi:radical SAM protein [Parendozoicomonas haliclonae]|uniref:Coproporphyrinogen III oxidase n=1 Tax=Parendozoicomonas haliclonae TaxID=1960125 RepID=A0A1X7ARA5_9GAMM|nr:radical SAM protein [Parendozoicomonas haliclonae]SMA50618.1 coproporphyrinogen III oxidase [Parendozoicomonas haliclonae]
MRYEGKIYRPWPEAESVLLQVTLGCSVNTCTFCSMFRDKTFSIRELDAIFQDIEGLRRYYPEVKSLFLIDGNVLVIPTDKLLKILNKITDTFPEIENIAMYAGFNDLRRKSVDELKALKAAGLCMVYTGLESGDPVIIERINKRGMTHDRIKEGMAKAREAGIRVLASFIFGLGGRERSREHIEATTRLLNEIQPDEIAPMALAIQPGTEMEDDIRTGRFLMPSPLQVLEEEQYLLDNLEDFPCYYWGDHGNNISPMRGMLPQNRNAFRERIAFHIANNPVTKKEVIETYAW